MNILEQAAAHRKELIGGNDKLLKDLAQRYTKVASELSLRLNAVEAQLATAKVQGTYISPGLLFQREHYSELLQQSKQLLDHYSNYASKAITLAQSAAIDAAATNAAVMGTYGGGASAASASQTASIIKDVTGNMYQDMVANWVGASNAHFIELDGIAKNINTKKYFTMASYDASGKVTGVAHGILDTLQSQLNIHNFAAQTVDARDDLVAGVLAKAKMDGRAIGNIAKTASQQTFNDGMVSALKRHGIDLPTKINKYGYQTMKVPKSVASMAHDAIAASAVAPAAPIAASGVVSSAASWHQIPAHAVEHLVGTFGDGTPLADVLNRFGTDMSDVIKNGLTVGLAAGDNPIEIARKIRKTITQAGNDIIRIARTEVLRSYTQASMLNYRNNPDVVKGWIWSSGHSSRTCAACWGKDGTLHNLQEDFGDHVCGRCSPIPYTGSEMGAKPWDSEDAFAKLPDADQRRILGASKHQMHKDGDIILRDIPKSTKHPFWGTSVRSGNLDEVKSAAAARNNAAAKTPRIAAPQERATTTHTGRDVDAIPKHMHIQSTATEPAPLWSIGDSAKFQHKVDNSIKSGVVSQVEGDKVHVQYTGSSGALKTVAVDADKVMLPDGTIPKPYTITPHGGESFVVHDRGRPAAALPKIETFTFKTPVTTVTPAAVKKTTVRKPRVLKAKPPVAESAVPDVQHTAPSPPGKMGKLNLESSDVQYMAVIQSLGGSTGAKLVQDSRTGKKYVMKRGASDAHIREECATDTLYQHFGANVPDYGLVAHPDGNGMVKFSEYIDNTRPLGDISRASEDYAIACDKLKEHIGADCVLQNWDVLGADMDNILVSGSGATLNVWRIDNGGGLRFRARGETTFRNAAGDTVKKDIAPHITEWNTLQRLSGHNGVNLNAEKVFVKPKQQAFVRSIKGRDMSRKQYNAMANMDLKLPDSVVAHLGGADAAKLRVRISEAKHMGETGITMLDDKWDFDYIDEFIGRKIDMRNERIFDRMSTTLKPMSRDDAYHGYLYDENGVKYDNIRKTGGVSDRFFAYVDERCGVAGSASLTQFADNQANSSAGLSTSYKRAWASHRDVDIGKYYRASGPVMRLSECTKQAMVMQHAFTHEIMSQCKVGEQVAGGKYKLIRQDGSFRGAAGTSFTPPEGHMLESYSVVYPAFGTSSCAIADVPIHRIFMSYVQSEKGSHGAMLLNDRENEFVAMTEGLKHHRPTESELKRLWNRF